MTNRFGLTLSALAFLAGGCSTPPSKPIDKTQLSWLPGCWMTENGRSAEVWQTAEGSALLTGSGFRLQPDQPPRLTETVIIENTGEDGILAFIASPVGQTNTSFHGRPSSEDTILFSNEAHDYPQIIEYSREGDKLHARISLMDGSSAYDYIYLPCSEEIEALF